MSEPKNPDDNLLVLPLLSSIPGGSRAMQQRERPNGARPIEPVVMPPDDFRGRIEALVGAFSSLTQPPRILILFLLMEHGELCVGNIARSLSLPSNVTSMHLSRLRGGRLVEVRKAGVERFYRLAENYLTAALGPLIRGVIDPSIANQ